MSRVCIVGTGIPAYIPARVHRGPGLRTEHFTRALARDGHDLLVLWVDPAMASVGEYQAASCELDGRAVASMAVAEADLSRPALARAVAAHRPEALVGVGAGGAAFAARLGLDLPMWADVFGDPMAEAQAKALLDNDDTVLVRFWSILGPLLERADRFSAVSGAQAGALLGQLGLSGRLSSRTIGEELVSVIECAAENGADPVSATDPVTGTPIPEDAFVVLWSGSFNTWCDIGTLFRGVEAAMALEPRLHFVATGGGVDGHDERSYPAFRRMVGSSPYASRFHLRGWVPSAELSAYYRMADLGLVVERTIYERRLGAENRVVQWLAHGLPCLTTAQSELGRSLVERGMAFSFRPGDPESLTEVLRGLLRDRDRLRAAGRAGLRYVETELSFERTAAPLVRWCRQPVRAGDAGGPRPLSVGLFSEPAAVVHLLEAYLASLSLGQLGFRGLRWIGRRLRGRDRTQS